MKMIKIKAKSSSGNYYLVDFELSDVIKVRCNCNAGMFGKLCKHKLDILSGDQDMLYDKSELPLLNEVIKLVQQSEFLQLKESLVVAKKAIDEAKKQEKLTKQLVEKTLKEGIPLKQKC